MRDASTRFAAAVRESHRVISSVEVLAADATTVLHTFERVVSGAVSADRTAAIRSRCDITVAAGAELAPGQLVEGTYTYGQQGFIYGEEGFTYGSGATNPVADLLVPFGNMLRLKRGIRLDDGTDELIDLGTYRIQRVDVDRTAEGVTLRLSGSDVSRTVARNRWVEPYAIAVGTNYAAAIRTLLTNRDPNATFQFASTSHTTPLIVLGLDASGDPWRDARTLAESIGMELHASPTGYVLAVEPDPDTTSASQTLSVSARSVITRVGRSIDDADIYNGVVATGEGTSVDPPVRAVQWDNNPESLTYYLGQFGKVPYYFSSPLIASAGQAADAAYATLRTLLGFDDLITLDLIPDPRIAAGDIIRLAIPDLNIRANYLVQTVACPMVASEPMQLTVVRRRQTL